MHKFSKINVPLQVLNFSLSTIDLSREKVEFFPNTIPNVNWLLLDSDNTLSILILPYLFFTVFLIKQVLLFTSYIWER